MSSLIIGQRQLRNRPRSSEISDQLPQARQRSTFDEDSPGARPLGQNNLINCTISAVGDLNIVMSSPRQRDQPDQRALHSHASQLTRSMQSQMTNNAHAQHGTVTRSRSQDPIPRYNNRDYLPNTGPYGGNGQTHPQPQYPASQNHYQYAGSTLAPPDITITGNTTFVQGDWSPSLPNNSDRWRSSRRSSSASGVQRNHSHRTSNSYATNSSTQQTPAYPYPRLNFYATNSASQQVPANAELSFNTTNATNADNLAARAHLISQNAQLQRHAEELHRQADELHRQVDQQHTRSSTAPDQAEVVIGPVVQVIPAHETRSGRYAESYNVEDGRHVASMDGFFDQ